MICHLVLYRMKPEKSAQDEDRLLAEARRELARLPGVKNLRVGRTLSGPQQGYTLALAMEFDDQAALEAYRVHPGHQRFVKEIAEPVVAEVLRFDFASS
jgi:quinol monooxygenase YgiN